MKKIVLSALFYLSFVSLVWSASGNYKCPTVSAIQQVSLNGSSIYKSSDYYNISQTSQYGTQYSWKFDVKNISVSTDEEALEKATLAVNTLSGNPEPEYVNGLMNCVYENAYGYMTRAYTEA